MSEEILEKQSEELEEEQQAVAESSGKKIKEDDAPEEEGDEEEVEEAKEVSEEGDEEEEEVEEAVQIPKTKAGMVNAIYDQLNSMKKAELSDSFGKIMGSTLSEEDEEEEGDDEEEVPAESKKLKKEDLKIDVKEDIEAITSGEDLSEEFKTKAATIFETAVSAKVLAEVNERLAHYEEEYKKELDEAKEAHNSTLSEKVDGYLNYVVEEWMKENEIAVEKGIRSELVEDFMTGLKNLFQEHYIDIPEEKVDLVDDLFEKVEELEKKLDESINHNVGIKTELAKFKREESLREVSQDLADTEKEKLGKLAEGIDYEDEKQFSEKLEVIKENYFPKTTDSTQPLTEEVENTTETEEVEEKVDENMSIYVDAMKRHN